MDAQTPPAMSPASSGARPLVVCTSPSFGTTSTEPEMIIEAGGAELITVAEASLDKAHLHEAVALIVGTQLVDRELLSQAPNLLLVAKHGSGIDNIDLDVATEMGVAVTSAAGVNASAVAELTMGFVIALARGIVSRDAEVRRGVWTVYVGKGLDGAVLGILGLGQVGSMVARRARAFDMEVLGHDPWVANSGALDAAVVADLDELLERSDFLSVHVPLTPETDGLIGDRELRLMKEGSFVINTSRGGIVDEEALFRALSEGWIAGAALDVLRTEPFEASSPLTGLTNNLILTPHMGAYTDTAVTNTSLAIAESVAAAVVGTWPSRACNTPNPWRGDAVAVGKSMTQAT